MVRMLIQVCDMKILLGRLEKGDRGSDVCCIIAVFSTDVYVWFKLCLGLLCLPLKKRSVLSYYLFDVFNSFDLSLALLCPCPETLWRTT
jgi:hypothetical protein